MKGKQKTVAVLYEVGRELLRNTVPNTTRDRYLFQKLPVFVMRQQVIGCGRDTGLEVDLRRVCILCRMTTEALYV